MAFGSILWAAFGRPVAIPSCHPSPAACCSTGDPSSKDEYVTSVAAGIDSLERLERMIGLRRIMRRSQRSAQLCCWAALALTLPACGDNAEDLTEGVGRLDACDDPGT